MISRTVESAREEVEGLGEFMPPSCDLWGVPSAASGLRTTV